jgi:DNA-binding MarR family transcriptional regulator
LSYKSSSCEDIFDGLVLDIAESEIKLKIVIKRVLLDNNTTVNMLFINSLFVPFTFTDDGLKKLLRCVYNGFNEATQEIADKIQEKLDSGEFSVKYALKVYEDYCNNYNTLKTLLFQFRNYVEQGDNKFILNSIRGYTFYKNVVDHVYKHDGDHTLYSVISKHLSQTDKDIIVSVFKFQNSFNGFCFSVKDLALRKLLFNEKLSESFEAKGIVSNTCINEFNNNIDRDIRSLLTCNDTDEYQKKMADVIDTIKTCIKVGDDIYFLLNYINLLQKRLLECPESALIDNELIKGFSFKDYPDQYIAMKYMISDVNSSKYMVELFNQLIRVQCSSERFASLDPDLVDFYSTKFYALREFAWKNSDTFKNSLIGRFSEPDQLHAIVYTWITYYSKCFTEPHKYRKLDVNYDVSTVSLDIPLGNVTYDIRMTLLQSMIYLALNDNGDMTVAQLSAKLEIPVKDLTYALNSLIATKLVNKTESSSKSDTSIVLSLNMKWKYKTQSVNIVPLVNQIKAKFVEMNAKKEASEKAHRTAAVTTALTEVFKSKNGQGFSIKDISSAMDNKYEPTELLSHLETMIKSGLVTTDMVEDNVVYKLADLDDSDLDSVASSNNDDDPLVSESEDEDEDEDEDEEEVKVEPTVETKPSISVSVDTDGEESEEEVYSDVDDNKNTSSTPMKNATTKDESEEDESEDEIYSDEEEPVKQSSDTELTSKSTKIPIEESSSDKEEAPKAPPSTPIVKTADVELAINENGSHTDDEVDDTNDSVDSDDKQEVVTQTISDESVDSGNGSSSHGESGESDESDDSDDDVEVESEESVEAKGAKTVSEKPIPINKVLTNKLSVKKSPIKVTHDSKSDSEVSEESISESDSNRDFVNESLSNSAEELDENTDTESESDNESLDPKEIEKTTKKLSTKYSKVLSTKIKSKSKFVSKKNVKESKNNSVFKGKKPLPKKKAPVKVKPKMVQKKKTQLSESEDDVSSLSEESASESEEEPKTQPKKNASTTGNSRGQSKNRRGRGGRGGRGGKRGAK